MQSRRPTCGRHMVTLGRFELPTCGLGNPSGRLRTHMHHHAPKQIKSHHYNMMRLIPKLHHHAMVCTLSRYTVSPKLSPSSLCNHSALHIGVPQNRGFSRA
jgi:hypothetical protein